MADPAKKGNVALEEDDEFEDFPQEEWEPSVEDLKKKELWDKSWDDDSLDDPVGQQLRTVLPTVAQGAQAQQQAQQ
ncbi:hypothetical protein CHLRE_06g263750v5 [Chlamydomonas reinhardtii]|uniref:26S proteasome complex subunit SEM1 n=1 Tax=Chlamydomonas reinhardtii TaxID=3055 RepID=A0A2K3DMU9_CHLRE|nr:uncharacterized protein CHLRE_06g263750v5 [Chlamydomonas reinhardtii]PNW81867.1 hypothetical protein CHLRE_06g263750v5 [Chlamydomonas reinhardtii]